MMAEFSTLRFIQFTKKLLTRILLKYYFKFFHRVTVNGRYVISFFMGLLSDYFRAFGGPKV